MFRFEYMSLTQLGEIFGVSNQQVGRWLTELELRTVGNKPSQTAFAGGFVKQMPSRNGGYSWSWHTEKTVAALEAAGHYRSFNPPTGLVESSRLNGSFSSRKLDDGTHQIVSGNGSVAIVVSGEGNATFLTKILNLAHKHGVVEKHLAALAV